ncbi:MAG: carbon-nitrogen hydrolase family protein [Actinomycetota bacterium]
MTSVQRRADRDTVMSTDPSDTPTETLAVAVAQPLVITDDLAGNAERHAELVDRAGARVMVFPELSLTGYDLAAAVVDPNDPRLAPLVEACAATGAIALAGAPTAGPDGDRLSVLAVDGAGARAVYHKVNLGGDEPGRFRPGPGPAVIEVDGWRLGLAVCKDTGVAEHATDTAALGVDAYLAGVCEHAVDAAVVGERAQRIAATHRLWVGVASFAGSTGEGYDPAAGGSGVWSPSAEVVDQAGTDTGQLVGAVFVR